jgi:hypothetical protein
LVIVPAIGYLLRLGLAAIMKDRTTTPSDKKEKLWLLSHSYLSPRA